MTKSYFQEFAAEQGWQVQEDMAFGTAGGYPFSLRFDGEGGTEFTLRFAVNGPVRPAVKALGEKPIAQINWYGGGKNDDVLIGVSDMPSDFYAKATLHTMMDKGPKALREAGLKPGETCPLCGLPGPDRTAWMQDGARPVHAACLEARLELPEEDSVTPIKIRGHWLTGILGALLGGYIGALPNWATALSKGAVSAVLYAFIPIVGALMYRLLRGKAKLVPSGIILLLSSLFVAFSMEPVWYWVVITDRLGFGVTLVETTNLLMASQSLGNMLSGMVTSLIFTVAGFFPAVVLLRAYAQNGLTGGKPVRGARFVRQSARPWPDADAPPVPAPDALAPPEGDEKA